jgi:tRNA U34 5-methylaminomethyl-2-thiouridine-forming methyltransferase MnmC
MTDYQLKTTSDGSHTIFILQINEQFHSLNGAVTESMHVFIEHGYLFSKSISPVILEIGFGTGLNCLLTAMKAEKLKRATTYLTIDNNILPSDLIGQLNYDKILPVKERSLFSTIHEVPWGEKTTISDYFALHKIHTDVTKPDWHLNEFCDIVYFDAFGPEKQPEMWTEKIFRIIFEALLPGGVFVTYSAKGEVRRRLTNIGLTVNRLPGPPGKKEMLRGIKRSIN